MTVRLAKNAGFCPGVRRATEAVEAALSEKVPPRRILTLGELIHNPVYLAALASRGVTVTDEAGAETAARESDTLGHTVLFLRTHGVSRATEERMHALAAQHPHFEVRDLTCPFVKRIHAIAEGASTHFLLFGKPGHPEVEGTLDRAPCPVTVFDRAATLSTLSEHGILPDTPLTVAAQTTMGEEEWKNSKKILEKLYTNAIFFDTICGVTQKRQEEAAILAASADLTVVIGGRNSSNTRELYELCAAVCPDTRLIERPEELTLPPSRDITVAITAGASTPDGLIMEVYKKWTKEVSPSSWKKRSKL